MSKLLRGLDWFLDWVTLALLAILLVVVGAQIFFRYALNHSLFWSEELARYLFIYLVFLGAAIVLRQGRHIQVSFFVERLPPPLRRGMAVLVDLLLLAFVGTVLWQSIRLAAMVWTVLTAALLIPWTFVYLGITLGMGAIEIKAMVDNGYDVDFSAAVTAASSTIAPIIPPSIAMVVYGVLASTSVGALFLGGFIPGVLMGLFMMAYSYVVAVRRDYPLQPRARLRELVLAFRQAFLGRLTPTILLGGIAFGIFTPTEAAVAAVFYTLILGVLVYRRLGVRDLVRIFRETVQTTSVVVFVMTTASLFAWIMAREQVPQRFAEFVLSATSSPAVVLLFINILGLIMGCFFDGISILVIVVPIFLPILDRLGIDRVHFGVMFVLNTVIGLITPPVGVVLYATVEVAKISFERVVRATIPFIWPMLAALILITYVPWTVLVIPRLFGFR